MTYLRGLVPRATAATLSGALQALAPISNFTYCLVP